MALEPVPDPEGAEDLIVEGSDGQLSLAVGGRKPTTSSLTLVGGKIDVEGQFKKGEIVVVQVECVVGEIAFKDLTDSKTNQVVGCARRHKARIVGSSIVESHPPADLS